MILQSSLPLLPLQDLEQGRTFAIAITNAFSAVTLQFRHAGDTTYRNHPDFTAVTPSAKTVSRSVLCFTTDMRLWFASVPTENYRVTCLPTALANF